MNIKKTKKRPLSVEKQTGIRYKSTDTERPVWLFDMLDKNGAFAFDFESEYFDHKEFLVKMINYSSMTWSEIKRQTHDDGKSKHHILEYSSLSKEARDRIGFLEMGEFTDSIFSFAFPNLLRVIGIREDRFFHVVWYDREHKFCPSKKKNT